MDLRREEKKEEWMELDVNLSLEWKSTAVCCGGGDFPAECTHKSQSAHRKTHCLTAMPNYQRGCEFVFLKRSFSFQIWTAKWNGIYWEKVIYSWKQSWRCWFKEWCFPWVAGIIGTKGIPKKDHSRECQIKFQQLRQQKGTFLVHDLLSVHNHRAQK